jgi:hypothetical protein
MNLPLQLPPPRVFVLRPQPLNGAPLSQGRTATYALSEDQRSRFTRLGRVYPPSAAPQATRASAVALSSYGGTSRRGKRITRRKHFDRIKQDSQDGKPLAQKPAPETEASKSIEFAFGTCEVLIDVPSYFSPFVNLWR